MIKKLSCQRRLHHHNGQYLLTPVTVDYHQTDYAFLLLNRDYSDEISDIINNTTTTNNNNMPFMMMRYPNPQFRKMTKYKLSHLNRCCMLNTSPPPSIPEENEEEYDEDNDDAEEEREKVGDRKTEDTYKVSSEEDAFKARKKTDCLLTRDTCEVEDYYFDNDSNNNNNTRTGDAVENYESNEDIYENYEKNTSHNGGILESIIYSPKNNNNNNNAVSNQINFQSVMIPVDPIVDSVYWPDHNFISSNGNATYNNINIESNSSIDNQSEPMYYSPGTQKYSNYQNSKKNTKKKKKKKIEEKMMNTERGDLFSFDLPMSSCQCQMNCASNHLVDKHWFGSGCNLWIADTNGDAVNNSNSSSISSINNNNSQSDVFIMDSECCTSAFCDDFNSSFGFYSNVNR
ncbi:unnamed protein product [Trichobilharzia regenti]|nr:unnamed protein product [Trichobilharzia regenti]